MFFVSGIHEISGQSFAIRLEALWKNRSTISLSTPGAETISENRRSGGKTDIGKPQLPGLINDLLFHGVIILIFHPLRFLSSFTV